MTTDTPTSEAEDWIVAYNAALDAGLSDQEAAIFATGGGDIDELARLIEGGCPVGLLAAILL